MKRVAVLYLVFLPSLLSGDYLGTNLHPPSNGPLHLGVGGVWNEATLNDLFLRNLYIITISASF